AIPQIGHGEDILSRKVVIRFGGKIIARAIVALQQAQARCVAEKSRSAIAHTECIYFFGPGDLRQQSLNYRVNRDIAESEKVHLLHVAAGIAVCEDSLARRIGQDHAVNGSLLSLPVGFVVGVEEKLVFSDWPAERS